MGGFVKLGEYFPSILERENLGGEVSGVRHGKGGVGGACKTRQGQRPLSYDDPGRRKNDRYSTSRKDGPKKRHETFHNAGNRGDISRSWLCSSPCFPHSCPEFQAHRRLSLPAARPPKGPSLHLQPDCAGFLSRTHVPEAHSLSIMWLYYVNIFPRTAFPAGDLPFHRRQSSPVGGGFI